MKRQISQLTGIILSFALLASGCTGGAGGTAEDDGRGEGVSDPAAIAAEWDIRCQ